MDKKIYTKTYNGKIKVVDPNKTIDENGVVEDRYVAAEDLVMYLNVKARINPRSRILNNNGEEQLVDIATIKSVNFLKPVGKKEFTTDWTEMFNQNDISTDLEGFGVQNVNVKFNASYLPEISMEFVDVRGQNLFIKGDHPNSPYNLFFSFPYPIFFLTMKGYYGKAIQLPLAMTKTNTRFDGETGNYITSCEFKSWTFGFFNDFNLSYLLVVPFMYKLDDGDYEGRQYLERVYKRNPIYLEDGVTLDPVSTGYFTMVDLIYGITDIQEAFKTKSPQFVEYKQKYAEYSEINNRLTVLQQNVNDVWDTLDIVNDERIQEVNEIYNHIEEQIDHLRKSQTFLKILKLAKVNDSNNFKFINQTTFIKNQAIGSATLERFEKILKEIRTTIDKELKKLTDAISDRINETADEILGFTPNFRNVMYIIANNLQAFIDLLMDKSKLALEQCKVAQDTRNSRYNQQIQNGEYDILNSNPRFYPWPEYYKQALSSNEPPERTIPSIHSENRDWEEIIFIDELLLATARLDDIVGSRWTQSLTVEDVLMNVVSVYDIDGNPSNEYDVIQVEQVLITMINNAQDVLMGGGLAGSGISDTDMIKLMTELGRYDGVNLTRSISEQMDDAQEYKVTSVLKSLFRTNGYANVVEYLLKGMPSDYKSTINSYAQVFTTDDSLLSKIEHMEDSAANNRILAAINTDNRSVAQTIYPSSTPTDTLNSVITKLNPADNIVSDDMSKFSSDRKNAVINEGKNILLNINNINIGNKFFENSNTSLFDYGNVSEDFNYKAPVQSLMDSEVLYNSMFFTNKFKVDNEVNPLHFNSAVDNE